MNSAEIKAIAKQKLKGKLPYLWKGLILLFILDLANNLYTQDVDVAEMMTKSFQLTSILLVFFVSPLRYGTVDYVVDFVTHGQAKISSLFKHYRDIIKIFVLVMFIDILFTIGLFLFVIPGFVLMLGFIIVPYMYRENRELDIIKILKLSWNMMKGYKMNALFFELSFILWYLFVLVTFGFGILWVYPYVNVSRAIYYNQIKQNYYAENII